MTVIAIIFGVILILVLFAEPIFSLLDFLLGILEGIVDIFDEICYYVGKIFDSGKRAKSSLQQKKTEHDDQVLEKKRKQQQKELQNFQSVDELPNDAILLERLYNDFKSRGDQKRGFICLNKAVSLGLHKEDELSVLYLAGIGTEENEELAKKYQVQYFKREIKGDKDLPKWEAWFKGEDYFRNYKGMREVAENLVENKNILGLFLLDYVNVIEAVALTNDQDKKDEVFEKYENNPYFIYFLSMMSEDTGLLSDADNNGCYIAAVKTNHKDMIDILKEYANQIIKQDHLDYRHHQTNLFVDLNVIYNKEYQAYLSAHSLAEKLPHYEVIAKLGGAHYPQARNVVFIEAANWLSKKLKSLDEIKFAYLTALCITKTYDDNFAVLEGAVDLIRSIVNLSVNQHYDEYLKKSTELCIDVIPINKLQEEKWLIKFIFVLSAYFTCLPKNQNHLYNKDRIIKKGVDKLEKAYSNGINGIIKKYSLEESEVNAAVVSTLTVLNAMK